MRRMVGDLELNWGAVAVDLVDVDPDIAPATRLTGRDRSTKGRSDRG